MTRQLPGPEVARHISAAFPDAVERSSDYDVWVAPGSILEVARHLKDGSELDMAFLMSVTAVDYVEYFEIVYRIRSMRRNHSAVLRARVSGRATPVVPSVTPVWRGAELQEREIWDLMGIGFEGHPNLKRILLWEGFPGHPLRKDYLG